MLSGVSRFGLNNMFGNPMAGTIAMDSEDRNGSAGLGREWINWPTLHSI